MIDPLVSIIIPVYNGQQFLRETVGTVQNQSHRNLEIIIVNDGSTDATREIANSLSAEDPRVQVVHQENKGLSAARNAGIRRAAGDFINFLDDDDWLFPDKIGLQLEALLASPSSGLAYSDFVRRMDGQEFMSHSGPPPVPMREALVYRSWFAPMVPLLRRELVLEVGLFDEEFKTTEDRDYWYRCSLVTDFLYVPGVLAAYRVHSGQMSSDRRKMNEGHTQFAEKHFASDRRRYRSCWAYHHLARARLAKANGDYTGVVRHLFGYVTSSNDIGEVKLVWELSR